MSAAVRGAAFFDVDGTLCATRSTTSLVWLRARQHSRLSHGLWLASLAWRAPLAMAADAISRDLADRMVFAQFAGLSKRRLDADARACCQQLLLPSCFTGALTEIARHRAAGRRIVLVSGGVEDVLAPLAQALGAELLAQRLVVDRDVVTGQHLGYPQLGEGVPVFSQHFRKAVLADMYARQTGIDLADSWAYGDTRNDVGMLESVARPVAVNPDRHLAGVAAARGWPVERWTVCCGAA
jgi:HAD superfamily hydrolase (TIGR01490 family)